METLSMAALPILIAVILSYGFIKGIDVFDIFLDGAKEGLQNTIRILPTLIGLMMAVTMLRESGLLEAFAMAVKPFSERMGISADLIPLALLRPVSGSGSSAYTISLLNQFGADSETGKIASVMSAATETTFYAIAVYFGATHYKKLYYTVPVALLGDLATFIFAVFTVKFL
ncbi:spore maturation protein [Scatolibacter rhodanostii]|uniref:spore maturation protein n=1 Tax=Scatolibacter rhodanostii TaxID=2014781 RepID=UPI001FA91CBD|nr:nucleoside recognition domain-containing protein [Scatolibacter rhodanostii]